MLLMGLWLAFQGPYGVLQGIFCNSSGFRRVLRPIWGDADQLVAASVLTALLDAIRPRAPPLPARCLAPHQSRRHTCQSDRDEGSRHKHALPRMA